MAADRSCLIELHLQIANGILVNVPFVNTSAICSWVRPYRTEIAGSCEIRSKKQQGFRDVSFQGVSNSGLRPLMLICFSKPRCLFKNEHGDEMVLGTRSTDSLMILTEWTE